MAKRWLLAPLAVGLIGCSQEPPKAEAPQTEAPVAVTDPAPEPDPEASGTVIRFKPPVGVAERYRSTVRVEQSQEGAEGMPAGPHSLTMETLVEAKAVANGENFQIEEKVIEAKVTGTGMLEAQAAQMQAQRQGQSRTYQRNELGEPVRDPNTPGAIPLLVTLPRVGLAPGFKWTAQMLISPALMGIEYTVTDLTPDDVRLEGRLFGEGVSQEKPFLITLSARTGQVKTMEGSVAVVRNGVLSTIEIQQSPA